MMQTVSAKEVLSAKFAPTTVLTDSDKVIKSAYLKKGAQLDKTPDDIYALVKNSPDYKTMHPTLKGWVEKNKGNFFQISPDDFILYRDADVGVEISFVVNSETGESALYFNRRHFKSPEDAAWEYKQTPAINPQTKKPWIEFGEQEMQQILDETKQEISLEDKVFLTDLLSILNENFHFYYGEEFVLLKGKIQDKSNLLGKYQPFKMLVYDFFDDFLPAESEQKRALSQKLGRAAYQVYKVLDNSKMWGITMCFPNKGAVVVRLKDGQPVILDYWNQVSPEAVDEGFAERSNCIYS